MKRLQTLKCSNCMGHGIISDYGPLGLDFNGEKECPDCSGSGQIPKRDKQGRFLKWK